MERVGAGLGDLADDGAAGTPEFRREVGGLEVDLLQFVVVGDGELWPSTEMYYSAGRQ